MITSRREGRLRSQPRDEQGAAAVEFALVMPILFLVVFGILQYGLYFNDSLNARQGVREAARMGVVKTAACGGGSDEEQLACATTEQVGGVTGDTYAMVHFPDGGEKGKPLVVCAMIVSEAGDGLLPMPNDGVITSKTQMSIEQEWTSPTTVQDPAPSGTDWSWCT